VKINLALWDRALRMFFGVLFTAWAIAGGPWWAYLGIYLILSASWALCPIYGYFKISTAPEEDRKRYVP
jgi:hypothetical protein